MNMQWMRDRQSSMLAILLFGIIIVVFALQFGPGSRGFTAKNTTAAVVNGEKVTPGEWSFYYTQLYNMYQRFDPNFNNEKAEQMNLRDKALEQIVNQILLTQSAERMGLTVSEKEAAGDILKSDAFKEEGKFNKEVYKRMVNYYYKMSVPRYEDKHRRDMAGDRLRSYLVNGTMVSENMAFDEWRLDNEKVALDFVKFAYAPVAEKMTVGDDEGRAFAAKEKEKVETYFKNHQTDYDKPEQVHARHILIRVAADDSPERQEAAQKKAKEAAAAAQAAPDQFQILVSKYSEAPNPEKGGDLGFFSRGQMIKEFEETAFTLEAGKVSDPIKTQFGWHVIKVEEKKAPEKKALEDVSLEIAKKLIAEDKAKAAMKSKAEAFYAALQAGKSFEELLPAIPAEGDAQAADKDKETKDAKGKKAKKDKAKKDKDAKAKDEVGDPLKLESTPPFSRTSGEYIPLIGANSELFKEAWTLKEAASLAAKVYEIGGNYYVVRLKEHKQPTRDEFVASRATETEQIARRFGSSAYTQWLKKNRERVSVEVAKGGMNQERYNPNDDY